MSDLEYRLNIVTRVLTDILWYVAQASVFEVLFHHAPTISGWTLPQARMFMAVLFLVDAIWMVLFQENLERLSWKVRKGELDLVLAKPVDPQFMLTVQKQNTSYIFNVIITFAYLIWTLNQLPEPHQWWRLGILFLVGLPVALSVLYAFRVMFVSLSVVFTNAESLSYVWYQIYRLGMRPDPLYPRWLRFIVLGFLPVGFVASVPARILMGDVEYWVLAFGVVLAATLLALSRWVWTSALTRYSSASS